MHFQSLLFLVHEHFLLRPLKSLFLLKGGLWADYSEQSSGGGLISGEESHQRWGPPGRKGRGARVLPLGGRGSSGEGLRRRVHGEGRPAEVLVAGGATPARERRRGWAGEVQGGERNPFRGSIGAEEGRNGGSKELRRRPAMVAMAGGLAGHARGAGLCPL